MILGDLGARVLIYYAGLEHQWLLGYQLPRNAEPRLVNWHDNSSQISKQFYEQSWGQLGGWHETLSSLLTQLQDPDYLTQILSANNQRLAISLQSELSGFHYLFMYDKVVNRLERYLKEISNHKRPLINLNSQMQ